MMGNSFLTSQPSPSCAELLGWELIAEYPDDGRIEIAFHPTAQMLNPRGTVQGGFVAAMLDDLMGTAFITLTNGAEAPVTLDMNVSFLNPVMHGRVTGKGRVIKRSRSTAFLEAELFDLDGNLLARSTSTARIVTNSHGQA
jgi:uncharacterized protein (TIGR00369 family)